MNIKHMNINMTHTAVMHTNMIEELIGYHCAPALAGIKPANIVACYKDQYADSDAEIERLNKEMNANGIYFEKLCECEKRILLMVYRQNKLEEYLKKPEIAAFLRSVGYPREYSLDAYLRHLKERLSGDGFPHEIGAFLGYPLSDIYGFIRGGHCLLVGDWKVYSNPERAKKLFARYNICKCTVLKRISEGKTLAQLFCAA